jgi:uncharacterized membrane protein
MDVTQTPGAPHVRRRRHVQPRRNVAELERWGSVASGAAAIAYGLSSRSRARTLWSAAGTALVYRGLTGHCPVYSTFGVSTAAGTLPGDDARAALAGAGGIHVHESVRLEKPVDEVYRFWRRFDNLPRFMTSLARVEDLGNGRSRWVAVGPAGTRVEWDAEIINEVENKVIGWRSLPGSQVAMAGSVNFDGVRHGSAQVTVHFQYAPPAGRAAAFVARLFGREPSQTIREDLRRLSSCWKPANFPRPPTAASREPSHESCSLLRKGGCARQDGS